MNNPRRLILAVVFTIIASFSFLFSQKVMAYGITSVGGSGWSGTLNYGSNSTIYVCYNSSCIIYTDVTASETVSGTTYYRKWQTCTDGVSWFTTSYSGSGSPSTSGTVSTYYRCVQRSTGGVVLAGSETPWVRVMLGPSFVSMPAAVSTTNITGTEFTAHWTTSSTPHGPSTMNIRHYMFCSTTPTFTSGTQAPGFNSACAKLITACTESTSAIAGCTSPSTPVAYTVTGLTPGVTYYWKIVAQSWHEESSNGDLWCGYQSSYTATQTVEDCTTPVITLQPSSQTICVGSGTNISVTATGATGYQWILNGTDIGGATSSSYAPSVAGSYTCLVYNDCDSVTTGTATILINSPTVSAAGTDQNLCIDSTQLAANTPVSGSGTWSIIAGGGSFSSLTDPNADVTSLGPGTNTFIWTLDNGVCTNSYDTVNVFVQDSSLAAAAITGDSALCSGENTTLSLSGGYLGGGASWTWYEGSCGGTPVGTGSSILVSPGTNTTYYARAVGGCNTTSCVSMLVQITSISADAGTNQTICSGDSTTLTASGGSTYLWSYNAETSSSITVTPAVTTTYTVTVTNGGCTASDPVTVTVTSMADAGITSTGPYCTGDSPLILSSVDMGGTWSGPGITNPSTGLFSPLTAGVGSHQIIHTISGSCGDADTAIINVMTSANASITPAGPFCTNSVATTLTAASAGGVWSGPGIIDSLNGSFNPALLSAGTYDISYTIPGSCGDADTVTISINAAPNPDILPSGPYCSDVVSVTLSSVTAGGTWSGQGITNAVTGTFSPSGVGAGNYIVQYSFTGSCPASSTETIVVNPAANATITGSGPYCNTLSSVFLVAADSGGIWSGLGITNAATGEFSPSSVGLGTYAVIYTISGTCGESDTAMVSVVSAPNPGINPSGPYCSSINSVTLSAVNSGGLWSGQGITDVFNGVFSPSGVGVGNWTVFYTLSGACSATDTISISVLPSSNATINAAGPFCVLDAPVQLTASDSGGIWTGSGVNALSGIFDPSAAGVGSHLITYAISGNCGDTASITIQVSAQADASINNPGSMCSNEPSIILTAATTGGVWSGSGIINPATGSFNPTTAGAGNHQIIYTITGNCGDSDTLTLTIDEAPALTVSSVTESCIGANDASALVTVSGGSTPYIYSWNNASGTAAISDLEPGLYIVTVTDNKGCVVADSIEIIIATNDCVEVPVVIYIPNIFSPNGDGDPVNNTLMVMGEGIKSVEFTVYDRWGEKLFESRDMTVGWDGTYKGKEMDQGVYVYTAIIEQMNGATITKKGNFTLLR